MSGPLGVLSLFSGIGGLELGLEQTGRFKTTCQVENDGFCLKILSIRWPNAVRATDIKEVSFEGCLDGSVRVTYPAWEGDTTMAGKLKKLTEAQVEESIKMHERGMSLAPIAEYFGVSRQAMWDLLRRRTEMRPQQKHGEDNHFYRGGATADDRAQNILEKAVQKGIVVPKGTCELCGKTPKPMKDGRSRIQAHHTDYNKPLEVMWLCQKCHHAWHKKNKAVGRKEIRELAHIDVVCGGFPSAMPGHQRSRKGGRD